MDLQQIKDIEKINTTPFMFVLNTTGCGMGFINNYMSVPGASGTVISMNVPYHRSVIEQMLGSIPSKFVSQETANALATHAFAQSIKSHNKEHCIGIGVTGSLCTDNERPNRSHDVFITIQLLHATYTKYVDLNLLDLDGLDVQEKRIRQEEEICDAILELLYVAIFPSYVTSMTYDSVNINSLKHGEAESGVFFKDGIAAIYPGSWNPFHDGHDIIYNMAEHVLSKAFDMKITPVLELTVFNVDKGVINHMDIAKRVKALKYPYYITYESTFVDKTIQLRKTLHHTTTIVFIVGSDTWNRIIDPKYAGDVDFLYLFFGDNNVRFLVSGRDGCPIDKSTKLEELRFQSNLMENLNLSHSSSEIRQLNS